MKIDNRCVLCFVRCFAPGRLPGAFTKKTAMKEKEVKKLMITFLIAIIVITYIAIKLNS